MGPRRPLHNHERPRWPADGRGDGAYAAPAGSAKQPGHVHLHDRQLDQPRQPVAGAGQAAHRAGDPARRKGGEPIVALTAYTMRTAQLLDPHCDLLLVGDSLGQVIYGLPSTIPVTLDMMCAHGAAVVRGSWHALVAVDMPFGSYEEIARSRPSAAPRGCSRRPARRR